MRGRGRRASWFAELRRPERGRLVAGVCAGLAEALHMDVTLLRLGMLLLALASGLGILLYLALWLLVPRAGAELPAWRSIGSVARGNLGGVTGELRGLVDRLVMAWHRAGVRDRWPRPLSRRWIAVGLIALGLLVFLHSVGVFEWLGATRALGLAVAVLGAALLASSARALRSSGEEDSKR